MYCRNFTDHRFVAPVICALILLLAPMTLVAQERSAAEASDSPQQASQTEPASNPEGESAVPDTESLMQMGVQGVALLAAQAYQQNDYERYVELLKKLVEMRPFNGQFRYRLAGGYALLNQKPQAFNELVNLQKQGLSYDPASDPDFANLTGTEAFEYLADVLKTNGEPFGDAEVAFSLERDDLLSESVTYDPGSRRFLVGSVRYGEIIAVDRNGDAETFISADEDNGLMGVFDIKVDSQRRHLWVASASVPHFRGYGVRNAGRTGLFKFDLDTGELLNRVMLEEDSRPHLLGNLALADNGDVFVTDSRLPVVYKLPVGGDQLEVVLANPNLTSLRGIALGKDDTLLYVSDYDMGVFATDLTTRESFGVLLHVSVNLSGIDGLYTWGDHLVAIQSGTNPQRIMRFNLSDDGRELLEAQPLLSNHPSFDGPTLGVLVDDSLVFVANSQWGAFSGRGEIIAPNELKPLVVLSLPVNLGLEGADAPSDGVIGEL